MLESWTANKTNGTIKMFRVTWPKFKKNFISFDVIHFCISIQFNYYYRWLNEKRALNIEHNRNFILMPIDFELGNLYDFPILWNVIQSNRKAFVWCHLVCYVTVTVSRIEMARLAWAVCGIRALSHILSFVSNQHHNNNNHLIRKTKTFCENDDLAVWKRQNNRKYSIYLLRWWCDLHSYWINKQSRSN